MILDRFRLDDEVSAAAGGRAQSGFSAYGRVMEVDGGTETTDWPF
jgi:hypothetical protein